MLEQLWDSGIENAATLLQRYAAALVPWAERTAMRMIGEIEKRDLAAWTALGTDISAQLHRDIRAAPMAGAIRGLLATQVDLITSIPRQAAEKAQALALEAVAAGSRTREVAAEIRATTNATVARAVLIARTETSRASTVLLEARCNAVDVTHYTWRTVMDSDVRPGHAEMEGKVCAWAAPPAVKEGDRIMHFHPGTIWNCRCYAEPIINDPYAPRTRGRKSR